MITSPDFLESLTNSNNQPDAAFFALYNLVDRIIGVRLFTLTTFDIANGTAKRVYSNMPKEYPVSGTKPIEQSAWTNTVIDNHKNFVANNLDEISRVFNDFELIESLGCKSVVNVPIVVGDNLLGTVNCLHRENYYTADRVEKFDNIKLAAITCFLLHLLGNNSGEPI